MFSKILVANRGEIACRVMRTARRMGIRTVAVYSEADAGDLHVETADEAYAIGPAPARDSYLKVDAVLEAARRSGAEAIHPGYGFLSENADFAAACGEAGIVFIGPPPAAIRAMGGKSEAKALMAEAGVPLVPGYHGAEQAPDLLQSEAGVIGFPVLIKASAGGGGKGMRVVAAAADFAAELAGAQREAKNAFGDERVLLEKYLERPRHVEIQVFADRHGDCVHLFERDCSIQRRHQKVIEEAPAPGLPPDTRERMGEAAVRAARAVGYEGAGTVEFLLDRDGSFFFMEMNTRLQVEHPVTEMITGQDLVEWQFRVAAGETLPLAQEELRIFGHAMEARLYAEDPARDFLPQTGRLKHLAFPRPGPDVRVETGVREGDAISIHYDPMIAKLVVWGSDRAAAAARLRAALAEVRVVGLPNNAPFLAAIAGHPAFLKAELDTRFIERHSGELLRAKPAIGDDAIGAAALGVLLERAWETQRAAAESHDPHSPWAAADGWRLNGAGADLLVLAAGTAAGEAVEVAVTYGRGRYEIVVGGRTVAASGHLADDGTLRANFDGVQADFTFIRDGADIHLFRAGESWKLGLVEPGVERTGAELGGRLTAPMPGKVVAVLVEAGAEVVRGQPLLLLEAMKMEHTITAPSAGTVETIRYAVGDQVEEGAELISFEGEDRAHPRSSRHPNIGRNRRSGLST